MGEWRLKQMSSGVILKEYISVENDYFPNRTAGEVVKSRLIRFLVASSNLALATEKSSA